MYTHVTHNIYVCSPQHIRTLPTIYMFVHPQHIRDAPTTHTCCTHNTLPQYVSHNMIAIILWVTLVGAARICCGCTTYILWVAHNIYVKCCPQYIRLSPTIGCPQYIPWRHPQYIRIVAHNIYICTHNTFRPR